MEVRALIHSLYALLLENALCAHCIGGWVGLRGGMDALKKRKSIALVKMVIH
jgi:hypothetical protein